MKEFLENPDKYEAEPENEDWKDKEVTIEHEYLGGKLLLPLWVLIAIAAVILLTSIFLIYICCAAARNRRARRNAEIQLELELERAQKEGIELPNELKKVLSEGKSRRSTKGELNSAIFSGLEEDFDGKDGKGKRRKKG